ncbi:MAG: hypothetical protein DA408_19535 [Bacteroidetes bacterium]|nr:MAG: hypothetical protein C7N36_03770 [Bacteroidota bacterium]PTM08931.1 MAG: hypothetical protein DA408_19535 [Bacteroidota bacterium]
MKLLSRRHAALLIAHVAMAILALRVLPGNAIATLKRVTYYSPTPNAASGNFFLAEKGCLLVICYLY